MITISSEKCVGCGLCQKFCPAGIISLQEGKAHINSEDARKCLDCGHCQGMCNVHAITINNEIEEVRPVQKAASFDEVKNLIESSRSIRFFKDTLVPKEKIQEILRVLDYTGSAKNEQPVKWIVVSGKQNVAKISDLCIAYLQEKNILPGLIKFVEAYRNPITVDAPHLLIAYTNKSAAKPYDDCMIKMTSANLLMHSVGIGSCYLGYLASFVNDSPALKAHLGIDESQTVYSALGFGYNDNEVYKNIPQRKKADVRFID